MSMDRLPDELLLMIFRRIDDHREKTRLERVCRRWHKIMRDHGWKHVRRVAQLRDTRWIDPIGARCGDHLTECSFYAVDIDPLLIRLIVEHFPKLNHLDFRFCQLKELDENALESFREFGVRLRSLTFFETHYPDKLNLHFLRHFSRLRHFGFHLSCMHKMDSFPSCFPTDLRSLYLSINSKFSPKLVPMMTTLQRDCPRLAALYLETPIRTYYELTVQLLRRLSDLKNLRFLRIAFDSEFGDPESLCSCLNNLPQLIALQIKLPIQHLSAAFRALSFRGLVHLTLALVQHFENCEPIGLLSSFAPQLRSFNLDITKAYSLDLANKIGYEMLKIAENGILEVGNRRMA